MKLSVVIPCLNGAQTLGTQLEALSRQRWSEPWELVFSDNGSTDGSVELVRSYSGRIANIRIVDATQRLGQPHALNTGIRAAIGESIALTDADDEIGDGYVAAMGGALAIHEFVACRTDGAKFNPPGLRLSPQREGLQKLWYPPWLPHAGGGTIGFRRSLFISAGDFDHALPYLHDTEFCIRAQMLGATLHFVPDAILYLRNRATFKAHYRQSKNWAEYNIILAKRYWPADYPKGIFWKRFTREWLRLAGLSLSALGKGSSRFEFAWCLGRQIGRAKGILKHGGVPV